MDDGDGRGANKEHQEDDSDGAGDAQLAAPQALHGTQDLAALLPRDIHLFRIGVLHVLGAFPCFF